MGVRITTRPMLDGISSANTDAMTTHPAMIAG